MPIYYYRAKDTPQTTIEGKIQASNREEAIRRIESLGYFPVKVEEISSYSPPKRVRGKLGRKELVVFTRQLGVLIKSGISILHALEVLSHQFRNPTLRGIIEDIHAQLREGSKFSLTLENYPKIFPPFYIGMVKAGEDSGTLQEALFRLAEYLKSQQEVTSRIKLALIYPSLMIAVAIGTVSFMFLFVMPKLMTIFANLKESLPLPTKIIISFSSHFPQWMGAFLLTIGVCGLVIKRKMGSKEGRKFFSGVLLKIPFLGELLLEKELARLTRTLEVLIRSGVSILRAIELTIPVVTNELIREELTKGWKDLQQGIPLARTFRSSKIIPIFVADLVKVGEEAGKLDDTFAEIAQIYERDVEERIKVFLTILEPLLILGIGLVVGFIVMAMLLPIFQINLAVR